jgi:hypothetical protein
MLEVITAVITNDYDGGTLVNLYQKRVLFLMMIISSSNTVAVIIISKKPFMVTRFHDYARSS